MIISDLSHLEVVSEPNIFGAVRAPDCVRRDISIGTVFTTATITNNCPNTLNVRGIWNFAFDDSCRTLDPGQYYRSRRGRQASLERVDIC